MPRPGIHLPLRNIPGSYPQQILVVSVLWPRFRESRVLLCAFMVEFGTKTLTVEATITSSAPCDARASDLC
jgi:hypothetical protein